MNININIWEQLKSELPKGDKVAARLAVPEITKKFYAGFDAKGLRHFLISLNKDDEELNDSHSRGLSVITRNLMVSGSEPKKYIDLTCHDIRGHVIFDMIGTEIAVELESGRPHDVIHKVLCKWRYFWGQSPRDLLSYEELIGLFAELWFLYHWLFLRTDKLDAVKSWRGPFSSRHDFELKDQSVEVKATTNVQSRIHKIHGIDQLSPPDKGNLLFFSLRIREEQGAKNSLPSIIELFQEKLKDNIDALSKFENTLAVAGYSPIHNEEYSKFKFRVVDQKLYSVTDNFPRIIIDSFVGGLPEGVGTIEYMINLDGYDKLCIAKSPVDKFKF